MMTTSRATSADIFIDMLTIPFQLSDMQSVEYCNANTMFLKDKADRKLC